LTASHLTDACSAWGCLKGDGIARDREMNICSGAPSLCGGKTEQTYHQHNHSFKLFLLENNPSGTAEQHLSLPGHLLHP